MSAPNRDDLERRLTELFDQRAATVTRVRQFDLGPAGDRRKVTGTRPVRDRRRWQHAGVLAAAAAVFVAVAATVLGIRSHQPHPAPPLGTPTPAPTTSSDAPCSMPAPASWQRAIAAGTIGTQTPFTAVVSANGATEDYLAIQGGEPADRNSQIYSDLKLTLFHGTTSKIIYAAEGTQDFPQSNPSGAISTNWVTFAVAYPHGSGYGYKVMLYDRRAGSLRTLAGGPGQSSPGGKTVRRAPVFAAGKVFWLASVGNDPATTTLESWDPSGGSAVDSVPAPDTTDLLAYGTGVLLVRTANGQEPGPGAGTTLRNGAGAPLPPAQLDEAADGGNFGFNGSGTLSWLRYDGAWSGYANLNVGGHGASYQPLTRQYSGVKPAIFPFTDVTPEVTQPDGSTSALLDLRTGTAVTLPAGVSLGVVVGDRVVFETGGHSSGAASGAAGLSLVPVSALPPVACPGQPKRTVR